jgi:hypothetical protein
MDREKKEQLILLLTLPIWFPIVFILATISTIKFVIFKRFEI